jgi:hypothetical protein
LDDLQFIDTLYKLHDSWVRYNPIEESDEEEEEPARQEEPDNMEF